jgi:hypothetical protein
MMATAKKVWIRDGGSLVIDRSPVYSVLIRTRH